MEQNTPKFRLRLNLFDTIVLVLALAVGAFLLWRAVKPAAPAHRHLHNPIYRTLPAVDSWHQ